MINFLFSLILVCAISVTLYGKSNSDSLQLKTNFTDSLINHNNSEYEPIKFANYFWSDIETTVKLPADFKLSEWLTICAIGTTISSLYLFDQNITDEISSHQTSSANLLTKIGNNFGEGTYQLPIGVALYLTSLAYDDKRLAKTLFYGAETFLLSGLMVQALKYSVGRARPLTNLDSDKFVGVNYTKNHNSFPSGHTQTAFSLASTFALEYNSYWVSIPAYSLATVTAYARVRDQKHWASDVFVGAVIGYFSARAVRKYHQKRERGWSYMVKPSKEPELVISYSF